MKTPIRKTAALLAPALALSLALALGAAPAPAHADSPAVKAVYHLNEGNAQATAALRNIRNHLDADPTAKIVVVTHSKGIDFLLDGAQDDKGNKYSGTVADLANKGVEFKVCNNTLVGRKIPKEQVILEAKIVPSGVAEVANLQFKERYAYVKP